MFRQHSPLQLLFLAHVAGSHYFLPPLCGLLMKWGRADRSNRLNIPKHGNAARRETCQDQGLLQVPESEVMPTGCYPRTVEFGLKMQKIARESVELWPYKEYTCLYCNAVFESRSHRAPTICRDGECLRAYHRDKLREWRERQ